MTASALLDELATRGIRVERNGDRLRLFPGSAVPPELARRVKARKAELLTLLARPVVPVSPIPPWDQAEAVRLFAELRREVSGIKRRLQIGIQSPLARLLDDAVMIGVRYVGDHEREAARGWDALALLRDLVPHVRDLAARWKAAHGRTDSIQAGITGE
jgi:hypothetical protein